MTPACAMFSVCPTAVPSPHNGSCGLAAQPLAVRGSSGVVASSAPRASVDPTAA
eukprot:CAMPEP_0182934524 /NCGR_PEP_ID=MMETSP0105_2-20130417/36307_1 /TAXON_ID=81532 ORGANISM="Acanthoeca-like sp., Strain 10tr" /NCGR_SAMPLE_ID=MMETSP0105_2 /ASSEMBLY_ACC=CAM_ASM_000205 /LENGTH=53 /DNA_ID=CAMNT_0025073387 /DNA_START=90 /DNA_END=247 /DNA_ORIENTATION=-